MGASSEIILGIDLGTTFSTAAGLVDGKLHFALDGRGEACVPSVVHFPRVGAPIVGAEADRLRGTDPANTIWGIKRLIGQSADSPAARLLNASCAFGIVAPPGGGEAAVVVHGQQKPASEVAALILRHLRERAEIRFQRRITKAILTVPVTATPAVKEAMLRCGKMAGLDVLRTLPEPVAGALSRGIDVSKPLAAPFLVYDFGGGTFDATVVQREGMKLRVLAAGGDDCLGGDDLDLAFSRFVADMLFRFHYVEAPKDAILWDRIGRQCEKVKRALSSAPSARFYLPDAFRVRDQLKALEFEVTHSQLEPRWSELVERSIECSKRTLEDAGLMRSDLGQLLLIGGTTFVPQVRKRVGQAFDLPLLAEDDPQTAVARGAALLAAGKHLLSSETRHSA